MSPPQGTAAGSKEQPSALKAAMREARIEAAERTGVIVDLRDAEVARLQILNDALDPLFADIPDGVDVCDRGISAGDPPRLWIDMIAHVVMAHDKRVYRLLQDTRYGRKILAESAQTEVIVKAVTQYVARRLIERERALASEQDRLPVRGGRSRLGRWRGFGIFAVGMAAGVAVLLVAAWFLAPGAY